MVSPPYAPAGAVVALSGECQPIHSGASAGVRLDDVPIGRVSGNTGGEFLTLIRIPSRTAVGPHRLRLEHLFVGSETAFAVTAVRPCVGDCDGSAAVTIDELITGVGVVSGARALAACQALDFDGDERAALGELVAAVAAGIEGCVEPPPLTAFPGRYTLANSRAGDDGPGSVRLAEADVTASDASTLTLGFQYGAGMARLTAVPSIEGGLVVGGTVEFEDASAAPATGSAVAITAGGHRWISAVIDVSEFPGQPPSAAFIVLSAGSQAP